MKIGLITDDYHPRVDGVVVYLDTISKVLEQMGHEVYIVCPKYPRYEEYDPSVVRVSSYDPLPLSKLTSRMMVTNNKTIERIESLKLDIIHVHTQAGANFAAYVAAKRAGTKLLTTVHTTYHPLIDVYPWIAFVAVWMGNFLSFRYYRDKAALISLLRFPFPPKSKTADWTNSYMKSVLDHSDLVITNSKHTRNYIKGFSSKTKVKIVGNGIDRSLFKPTKRNLNKTKTFEFVLTSRVSGEKRQQVAIKAISELIKQGLDCRLTLIGGGPNRKKCQKMIDDLGVGSSVEITGEIERSEVKKILSKSDVGLFTSYHFDTDPLAVMEYLSMGLPVIYCDENFEQMFVKGAAIKCDKNSKAFATAMKKIMSSATNFGEMSRAARKASDKHDIFDRVKELEQLYIEVIKTKSD